jgi:hypothetical protein
MQFCCEILKPRRLNGYVIVYEGKYLSARIHNPRIEGVGLTRIWLEQVTKSSRVAELEVLGDLACLIGRIIIYDEYFPRNHWWHVRCGETFQGYCQALGTVVCTQYYGYARYGRAAVVGSFGAQLRKTNRTLLLSGCYHSAAA